MHGNRCVLLAKQTHVVGAETRKLKVVSGLVTYRCYFNSVEIRVTQTQSNSNTVGQLFTQLQDEQTNSHC